MLEDISISMSLSFSESSLDNSFIVFFGIITPGNSMRFLSLIKLEVASLWPSVPTKVKMLDWSFIWILKY